MGESLFIFVIDFYSINWYIVFYILFCIAVVGMGIMKLFPMGTSTAVIYAIGSIMILVFYYYRWFDNTTTKKSPTWPPTINTCPDYFTYIAPVTPPAGGTTVTPPAGGTTPPPSLSGCIDMLGVSKGGQYPKVFDIASITSSNIFQYTSKDLTSASNITTICNLCRTKGITWEGVFDGDTCIANLPKPGSGGSGGSCH